MEEEGGKKNAGTFFFRMAFQKRNNPKMPLFVFVFDQSNLLLEGN